MKTSELINFLREEMEKLPSYRHRDLLWDIKYMIAASERCDSAIFYWSAGQTVTSLYEDSYTAIKQWDSYEIKTPLYRIEYEDKEWNVKKRRG